MPKFSIEFAGLCMLASYANGKCEVLLPDVRSVPGTRHSARLLLADHEGLKGHDPDSVVTLPGNDTEYLAYDIEFSKINVRGPKLTQPVIAKDTWSKLPDIGNLAGSRKLKSGAEYVRVQLQSGRVDAYEAGKKKWLYDVRAGSQVLQQGVQFVSRLRWTVDVPNKTPLVFNIDGRRWQRSVVVNPDTCKSACISNICAANQTAGINHFLSYYRLLAAMPAKQWVPVAPEVLKPGYEKPPDGQHCDPGGMPMAQ